VDVNASARVENQVSADRYEGGQVNDAVEKTSSSGSLSSVIRWGGNPKAPVPIVIC